MTTHRRLTTTAASVGVILALVAFTSIAVRQDTKAQKFRKDCLQRGGAPVTTSVIGPKGPELVPVCHTQKGSQ
jgi:uncharacterized membrane protein